MLLWLLFACSDSSSTLEQNKPKKLQIYTASFPADYLVRRVAQGGATVDCMLPVGEDAPFWNPSGELVATVSQADLLVVNGGGFEKWVATASIPSTKVLNTSTGLSLIETEGETHSHGKQGAHSHAGIDPHTWGDPENYQKQAQTVYQKLIQLDKGNKSIYDANFKQLDTELQQLIEQYRSLPKSLATRHLAANHPAYEYLSKRYNLGITSFDLDPEEKPQESQVTAVLNWSKDKQKPVMFWENQPTQSVQQALEKSLLHVVLDPLEQPNTSGTYDYIKQSKKNLSILQKLAQEAK